MSQALSAKAIAPEKPINLDQYRSVTVKENVWKGRLVRAGIIVGVVVLLAASAAAIAFGIMTANPLFIGIGLAVGTCVAIGAISYFSIDAASPDKERRTLQKVKSETNGILRFFIGSTKQPVSDQPQRQEPIEIGNTTAAGIISDERAES